MWKGPPIEEKTRKRIALLRSWRFKANICRSNWTRWQLLRRKINFSQLACCLHNVHAMNLVDIVLRCQTFMRTSKCLHIKYVFNLRICPVFPIPLRGNFIHYSFIWLHSLTPFWCISFKMLNRYSFIQLERGSRNSWYYANL